MCFKEYEVVDEGNESVDCCMTACDDEIGRWTTTQQPTNKRWRGGSGIGSSATAQRWWQFGGGMAATVAQRQRTA